MRSMNRRHRDRQKPRALPLNRFLLGIRLGGLEFEFDQS